MFVSHPTIDHCTYSSWCTAPLSRCTAASSIHLVSSSELASMFRIQHCYDQCFNINFGGCYSIRCIRLRNQSLEPILYGSSGGLHSFKQALQVNYRPMLAINACNRVFARPLPQASSALPLTTFRSMILAFPCCRSASPAALFRCTLSTAWQKSSICSIRHSSSICHGGGHGSGDTVS